MWDLVPPTMRTAYLLHPLICQAGHEPTLAGAISVRKCLDPEECDLEVSVGPEDFAVYPSIADLRHIPLSHLIRNPGTRN